MSRQPRSSAAEGAEEPTEMWGFNARGFDEGVLPSSTWMRLTNAEMTSPSSGLSFLMSAAATLSR